MRLHRFYTPEKIAGKKELTLPAISNQVSNVFRMRPGDRVILFDGSGEDFECEIARADTYRVISSAPSRYMPARKVYLCAAIVKKDNFEFIAEKATELGATDIVPVLAERTEKKAVNEERLRRIVTEASEQSGRGDVPTIHPASSLDEAIERYGGSAAVVFHTEGERFDASEFSQNLRNADTAVFIGPEGGWSEKEIVMFHANKIPIRSLGPQVLRAETAVVSALSQVLL